MGNVFNFSGKTAIVTGAGRGIGRVIAMGLAESGANVVLCSRTKTEIDAVAEEIYAKGGKALSVVTDLTVHEQLENLVNATVKEFGRIDILVNNAARSFLRGLLDLREDGWDKCFNTNVKAVWLLSRLVARRMIEQKEGKIINITTVGAEKAESGMAAYGCSKAALKHLTRCMAREWAPFGINVNAVAPGFTRTDFSKPIWSSPDVEKLICQAIPKGRIAEPEDVVGAVLFLASGAANYITGDTLYVDGGTMTI
ncbi:MAG TPA: 3-oxoacyl-ACP reductase family protein [Smithellaceae bacterium]|jgi:NAD(P)-dependent dehydrogenase (short-subunit alcohol dehydrogenase family)|nr:3-oxoacyl-ACP reductase family protein [Smithellaceae bacterium]HOQ41430.1 3-oxoacyl-ACP reductase family protein [Smithellaceae bacterium]HPL64951.1 3-oxoacyl-ACP reductase family protein [Smithellaceae bacterium]HQP24734.1 3-oxoacyl-ACP reductase family protein [Smithellaceae bacterium]